MIIAVVAALLFQCPDGSPPPCHAARTAAAPPMSVAVLDFENIAHDTADAYLSEGLAEELTVRLGQVERMNVASRAAVRRLRGAAEMPIPQIGRSLNVAYLVNGSVRRSGAHLRVAVELLRAATGAQVWADQYDRSDQDLLAIQQAVATAVATAVAGRLAPAERSTLASRPTSNPEAYDAYLHARVLFDGGVPEQQRSAVLLFQRAIALDSSFAAAWAGLSRLNSSMFWFYVDRSAERLALARSAADHAVALAPNAAETNVALGYYYYWGSRDYGRALQAFSAALAAQPRSADVQAAIANVSRRQGSWDQSLASRSRAIDIDPENRAELTERGLTYHVLRRFDDAAADYRHAMLPPADYIYAFMFSAALAVQRYGTLDSARDQVTFLAAHPEDFAEKSFHDEGAALPVWRLPGPHQAAILGTSVGPTPEARALHYLVTGEVQATLGRADAAQVAFDSVRTIVGAMLQRRPDDDGFHGQLALALAGLGRCDEALAEGQRSTQLLPVSADALTGPQRLQNLVEVEIRCGRVDQALDHLAYLLTIPSFITPGLLRSDPVFAPLRGNPRFDRMAGGN